MNIGYLLNIIGLIAEITGVILLAKYGTIGEMSAAILEDEELNKNDTKEQKGRRKYIVNLRRLSIYLILLGFLLQFFANILMWYSSPMSKPSSCKTCYYKY